MAVWTLFALFYANMYLFLCTICSEFNFFFDREILKGLELKAPGVKGSKPLLGNFLFLWSWVQILSLVICFFLNYCELLDDKRGAFNCAGQQVDF